MPVVGVVVLAAGASSRMGQPKQALLYNGKTLLARVIEAALQSDCGPVVVVLGANAEAIVPIVADYSVREVFNPDWAEGMNTSIRAGVDFLQNAAQNLDAVIVATCDQPFASADLFNEIAHTYTDTGSPIVASAYEDVRGVPALFDRALFPILRTLPAGAGAGRLIARQPSEKIAVVAFPEGAMDIDTPEDFARLQSNP